MKKILTKVWGIGLVVAILASLMLVAVPASPAAAATLAYSPLTTPSTQTFQLVPATATGLNVASLKVASNGHLFAIDSNAGNVVYKSIDGGRTWTASAPITGVTLVDLVISPSYATDNRLFVLASNSQAYVSTSGGITFNQVGTPPAGTGYSIAIAPNYAAGVGEVMIGANNGVYIWNRSGVEAWLTTNMTSTGAALAVAYSPNFPLDGTRLAVTNDAGSGNGTRVQTLVGSDPGWDLNAQLLTPAVVSAPTSLATYATMAIPSDFNAQSGATRTVYVGLTTGASDNISRASLGIGGSVAALTNPIGVVDMVAQSLAYYGTSSNGALYAGAAANANVYRCANPWAAAVSTTFSANLAAPTGSTGMTYVALASDFATSNKVYAGTSGNDSALSVSEDGGVYFWQNGLIDNAINRINDFQAASATEYWMATTDIGGLAESVWKSIDSGASWRRVLAVPAATSASNNGTLTISPNYATDKTVVYAVYNADTSALYTTNNSGGSWLPYTSLLKVGAFAMKDQYTFFVGAADGASVQATLNGAFFWQTAASVPGATTIADLKYDVATGHLIATGTSGAIARSTDGNVSYKAMGTVPAAFTGKPSFVAFDAAYATNSIVYACASGTAGIYRGVASTTTVWSQIDQGQTTLPGDIICAPDDTLYVSDKTAAVLNNATLGGITRSIAPTAPVITTVSPEFEKVAGADGLATGDTLSNLAIAQGSNMMFAINNIAVPSVLVYTDTLSPGTATAIPAQTAPANEGILTSKAEVTFRWNAVTGATKYTVQYSDRQDVMAQAGTGATPTADTYWTNTTALTGGKTYFWRVRVEQPVIGPWSETHTFISELAVVAPNQVGFPTNPVIPSIGGVVNSLMPTFQWNAAKDASGYEFQLATDAQFLFPIVDLTGADSLGAVNAYTLTSALEYNTNYFWRVKAISSTANSDWSSTQSLITMAKPVTTTSSPTTLTITAPTPTVTFTMPTITVPTPTVTVSFPSTTTTTEKIAPAYIWAIIIIGAVLVIAVIVLIVRTRRSV